MKIAVRYIVPLILVIAIPLILFYQKKDSEPKQIDRAAQQVFNSFSPSGLSIAVVKEGTIVYERTLVTKMLQPWIFWITELFSILLLAQRLLLQPALANLFRKDLFRGMIKLLILSLNLNWQMIALQIK
jgi:hypothetical protein